MSTWARPKVPGIDVSAKQPHAIAGTSRMARSRRAASALVSRRSNSADSTAGIEVRGESGRVDQTGECIGHIVHSTAQARIRHVPSPAQMPCPALLLRFEKLLVGDVALTQSSQHIPVSPQVDSILGV